MSMPTLAITLKKIAKADAKAFYEGAIAEDIATTVQTEGGLLITEDLASHKGEVVEPVSVNYRGLDIMQLRPNSQGIAALVLLPVDIR